MGLGFVAAGGALPASVAASLAPPASAVVVGPSTLATGATAAFENHPTCIGACTFMQWAGSGADPQYATPVDGTIVDWRIASGSSGSKVALRVLRPIGGGKYQAVGTSATVTTTGSSSTPDEFTTSLPVKAGDVIGLDNTTNALIFKSGVLGSFPEYWTPLLTDGASGTPTAGSGSSGNGFQLQIDAYVVPASTTTTSTSTSTPTTGTTTATTSTVTTTTTTTAPVPAVLTALCRVDSRSRLAADGITSGCTEPPKTSSRTFSAVYTARWGIQVPILGADHYLQIQVSKPRSASYLSGFRDSSKVTIGSNRAKRMRNGMFFVQAYNRGSKKGLEGTASFIAGGYVCNVSLYDRSQTNQPARAAFQQGLLAIAGSVAFALG